jgi:hypothetical protein
LWGKGESGISAVFYSSLILDSADPVDRVEKNEDSENIEK